MKELHCKITYPDEIDDNVIKEVTESMATLLPEDVKLQIEETTDLKLDLDGKNGLNTLISRIWILKYLGLSLKDIKVYDTVNGYHVVISCANRLSDMEIILFQLLLGEDYRRGLYNYLKVKKGVLDWNILFKEKYKINQLGDRIKVSEEKYNEELSKKIKDLTVLGM